MCVGTGVPPYPWANTTARSETCYPATSCASSKVPMVGKNCGWFSPILVSFSSKLSRMIFLWPVYPCWAIRSGIRIRPMASVKTMFSSWYSRITFTTLELRVNTPSKGIKITFNGLRYIPPTWKFDAQPQIDSHTVSDFTINLVIFAQLFTTKVTFHF